MKGIYKTLFIVMISVNMMNGCVTQPLEKKDNVKTNQIKVLLSLSKLEDEIHEYILAKPGIKNALVKVRPGKAIILVEPGKGKRIDPSLALEIYEFVERKTGIKKDKITLRLWHYSGGKK